jgi:hypothetical protein
MYCQGLHSNAYNETQYEAWQDGTGEIQKVLNIITGVLRVHFTRKRVNPEFGDQIA